MVNIIAVPEGVTLVAVSKTKPLSDVKEAYEKGYRIFGENHVQEIVEKYSEWKPSDVQVHMIGHLQTNKVGKVVSLADMIQSVDSLKLLCCIDRACARLGKNMPVLLEVNTSGEASKSGFVSEEDLVDCIREARKLENVTIKGFMTVGPVSGDPGPSFEMLSSLSKKLAALFSDMDFSILSMGMSGDWKTAVEKGSNMVRIGTAIFGERDYV